jgi:multiple sugar transport system ATP-binding protein
MAQVTLDRISKHYIPQQPVLHDVNLSIDDGEFVVLVGPSGCGKSTLLRMLSGLESISAGELRIGGRRVNEMPPADRGIAMVFQSYALYPHMNVYRNMAFGLTQRLRDKAAIDRRIREAARSLHIDHLLDRLPRDLSGGQRQRVAIGRAIVRQPELFLFDEPLSNLDAALRAHTRVEIAKLHRELNATIVYVTHDQVEAMTLADRIVVLHAGRIQQTGTPRELYDHPANRFVATFLGTPAMNILPAAAVGLGEGEVAEVGIRPEHLSLVPAGGDAFTLCGIVELVEFLGDCALIHLRIPGLDAAVVAKVSSGGAPPIGSALALHAPAACLHRFDGQGRSLASTSRMGV